MAAGNTFNLDDIAFERTTVGLMRPILILVVVEDENIAVVNPHLPQQPQPGTPLPQDPPNTEDSLNLESIMADAKDLTTFQELEGYRYREPDAGTDSDVPEDDESDVSDDDEATNVISCIV